MTDELPADNRVWTDEELKMLSERIEQDPKSAKAWAIRGFSLTKMRDYEGANRDFKEALRLDSCYYYALLWQGDLYRELGQYSEANDNFNKAIALEPGYANGYYHRGDCYEDQERFVEAIADYSKAADLKPDWSPPFIARARMREQVKDYDGALSDYDSFLRLERDCIEWIALGHGLRGLLYEKLGLYQEAIAGINEKLRLTPRDAVAYLIRSRLYKNTRKDRS